MSAKKKTHVQVVEKDSSLMYRQSVHAQVFRACPTCQAPGVFKAEERVKDLWPACYDPSRENQSVGDVCPQCHSIRPAPEELGEIHALEIHAKGRSPWQRLKQAFR